VEKLLGRLERVLLVLLAGLLAFITLGVFIQVVLRYVFATSFLWGEELSLFAFIWCVFIGAAITSWRRTHFAFDVFDDRLRGRAAGLQRLVVDLSMFVVIAVMLYYGWQFSVLSLLRMSPALGITLFVPTIIIPVSAVLMLLAVVPDMVRDVRQLLTGQR
jgi:TRAP-type C4-dicarboxylate transport system permease small subunit